MSITNCQVEAIEAEVEIAIETHAKSINEENCLEIFAFKTHKGSIIWTIKTCTTCNRPKLVHENPWNKKCSRSGEMVNQNISGEYIEQLNNNTHLKQIVTWVIPDVKTVDTKHSKSYKTYEDSEDEADNSFEANTPEDNLHYHKDRHYTYSLEANFKTYNLHDYEESEEEYEDDYEDEIEDKYEDEKEEKGSNQHKERLKPWEYAAPDEDPESESDYEESEDEYKDTEDDY